MDNFLLLIGQTLGIFGKYINSSIIKIKLDTSIHVLLNALCNNLIVNSRQNYMFLTSTFKNYKDSILIFQQSDIWSLKFKLEISAKFLLYITDLWPYWIFNLIKKYWKMACFQIVLGWGWSTRLTSAKNYLPRRC